MVGLGRARAMRGDAAGAILAMRDAVWHSPACSEAHAWIAHLLAASTAQGVIMVRGDEASDARRHRQAASRLGFTGALPALGALRRREAVKVGLLTVGSGGYARFFRPNVEAAEKYFLRGVAELHHFVFTDRVARVEEDARGLAAWGEGRVHVTHREHDGWPSASMKRAHTYYENRHLWQGMDYVFAVDVDTLCVSFVGPEVLADTVGTLHADNAFYGGSEVAGLGVASHAVGAGTATMWRQHQGNEALLTGAVYERRPESSAAIPGGQGRNYFAGGLYGGRASSVSEMLAVLVDYTDRDIARGVVARHHDESQINRYWLDHPPAVVLTCAYLYPEPTAEPCWGYVAPVGSDEGEGGGGGGGCVRDHGHPWLWSPWFPSRMNGEYEQWSPGLWKSHRRFPIRLLNLSKDKQKLLDDGNAGTG